MRLPMHRFVNHIYAWCIERVQPDQREEWEMMMRQPLPGTAREKPSPFTEEEEAQGFMALMAQTAGKG